MRRLAGQDAALVETRLPALPAPGWGALAREAASLRRDLGAPADDRGRWFAGQLEAVATTCRVRAGERLSWAEQVERCLGVAATAAPVERYAEAHRELAALLPGPGPLGARYARHRAATVVADPVTVATAVLQRLRARTRWLPEGERCEVVGVRGAAWSALCRSTGPSTSEVLLDVGRPWPLAPLVALVAHETVPGHHAERCLLAGAPERAVVVVATPEAVVTEGLGECALRASGLRVADVADLVPALDAGLADAVARAAAPLARTKTDAAVLLHRRGPQAARAHLVRWGLHDDARADAQLAFLSDPRWAVHAVAYGAGSDLVGAALDRGVPYRSLLGRPVVPGALAPA